MHTPQGVYFYAPSVWALFMELCVKSTHTAKHIQTNNEQGTKTNAQRRVENSNARESKLETIKCRHNETRQMGKRVHEEQVRASEQHDTPDPKQGRSCDSRERECGTREREHLPQCRQIQYCTMNPRIYLNNIVHEIFEDNHQTQTLMWSYAHGSLEELSGYDTIDGNADALALSRKAGEHKCIAVNVDGTEHDAIMITAYSDFLKSMRTWVCLTDELEETRENLNNHL